MLSSAALQSFWLHHTGVMKPLLQVLSSEDQEETLALFNSDVVFRTVWEYNPQQY